VYIASVYFFCSVTKTDTVWAILNAINLQWSYDNFD